MVDLGGTHLLRLGAGGILGDFPPVLPLVDVDRAQDTERIDAAAGPPGRGARLDFARLRISRAGFDRDVNADNLGDDGPRKLGADAAAFAGRVPDTEQQGARRGLENGAGILGRRLLKTVADIALH